ncbi:MAG TPA: acyltransferase [Xanthobacteraceae bacterium]
MGTLRFLLALAVALSHFGTVWGYYIMNGRMAVQCFYMISGFLISLVLAEKYDARTAEGRSLFYSNRALRIYVPYWSFCLFILAMHALVYVLLGIRYGVHAQFVQHWPEMTFITRVWLLLSNAFILTQEWAMWLAYQDGLLIPVLNSDLHTPHLGTFQMIPQAWSMSLELMFYAIAPFLLRFRSAALAAVILGTYLLRSLAHAYGLDGSGFVYRFFPFEIGLFLAGALGHRIYAQMQSRGVMHFPVSLAISASFIGIVLVQQHLDLLDNHKFFILVLLALPALFDVSRRFRLDRWLGELSYPIYLGHLAVFGFGGVIATRLAGPIADRDVFALAMAALTVLLAIAYVHFVDAPFERWRQRRATAVRYRPAAVPLASPVPAPVSA